MRAEVRRIRDAVANKDIVPMFVHFVYRDGMLYAGDGDNVAATPLKLDADVPRFFALASELHAFLDKISGEPTVKVAEDGTVTVNCGRMRAHFAGLAPGTTAFDRDPDLSHMERVELPENFTSRLKEVRPFVSENANKAWATCILYRRGTLLATSNIAIVSTAMPLETANDDDILIQARVADFLLSNAEGLECMYISEQAIVFKWSDGSWYNTSRLSYEFPAVEAALKSTQQADWEVPEEWRESIQHVMRLGEDKLEIFRDKILGRTNQGTLYEAESETPLPEDLDAFSVEPTFLGPVFAAAKCLKIYRQQSRVYVSFVTDTLKGVGVGRAN